MSEQASNRPTSAKPAGPCAMVIFGAAGDLTKRLVVPALYNLGWAKLLPQEFAIVGVDLANKSDDEWRESLAEMLQTFVKAGGDGTQVNQEVWKWLTSRMSYLQGDLNDPATYETVKSKLSQLDKLYGPAGNYFFYLAIASRFFGPVVEHLGQSCLACETNG